MLTVPVVAMDQLQLPPQTALHHTDFQRMAVQLLFRAVVPTRLAVWQLIRILL